MPFCIFIAPFILILGGCLASGEVYVTDEYFKQTIASYRSMPARFGHSIPDDGLKGRAVISSPPNACRPIKSPPNDKDEEDPSTKSWVVVISRGGGCSFEDKVQAATAANWTAAIVFNRPGQNQLVPMAGEDDALIPSVFMGYDDAQTLLNQYSYLPAKHPEYRIVLTDEHAFNINQYLLPFAIVVGICFIIMLVIVVYKCIQDYRRHRRHRLPKSALKKLPIHKFKEGDPFETCVICLDDFQEGDKLRVLPCDHGYHAKCIDPWLVKTKRICPQCRKRVFESNDRGAGLISASDRNSDSDSDTDPAPQTQISSPNADGDANTPASQAPEETSSNAPLLGRRRREFRFFRRGISGGTTGQRSRRAAGGGTFTSQSSVHAPPRNVTVNSAEGDGQVAGPSGTNRRNNISAVERLQRAFARESRQFRRGRGTGFNRLQNDSSSDNEDHSANLTDNTSEEEEQTTSRHQQQRQPAERLQSAYRVSPVADGITQNLQGRQQQGARSKMSARHVNAEVHVVPLDDKNVDAEVNSSNVLVIEESESTGKSPSSQNNDLSETYAKNQQDSHVVEIHPEQSRSPEASGGATLSSTEYSGGNVENV